MIVYKLTIDPVVYIQEIGAIAGLYVSVKAAQKAIHKMLDGDPITWHSENGYIWGATPDHFLTCSITEVKVKE
jgi:hypothetical protein